MKLWPNIGMDLSLENGTQVIGIFAAEFFVNIPPTKDYGAWKENEVACFVEFSK